MTKDQASAEWKRHSCTKEAIRLTLALQSGFCPVHELAFGWKSSLSLRVAEASDTSQFLIEICPWSLLHLQSFKPFFFWWAPTNVRGRGGVHAHCRAFLDRLVPLKQKLYSPTEFRSWLVHKCSGELVIACPS